MCSALEELMEDMIVERENLAKDQGRTEGKIEGIIEGREELIIDCLKRNKDAQMVSDFLGIPLETIQAIEQKMLQRA